jgi:uncharacterized protein YyaL (SSP411 family)
VPPGLDDKILVSWNGLMLHGYMDAYRASGEKKYLERGLKNADFIVREMIKTSEDYRMDRNYKDGKSSINAFLDDYAITMQAFLAVYQVTFDTVWLHHAEQLLTHVFDHFDGGPSGMFYFTSDLDPPLVARRVDFGDNVIPSANSIMARNLFTLGTILYKPEYIDRAKMMFQSVWPRIREDAQPAFYSNWCQLMLWIQAPPFEVAIVGNSYREPLQSMQVTYQPDVVYLGGKDEGTLPLLEDKLVEDQTFIYVCRNKVCKFPTPDPQKALGLITN